MKTRLLLHFVYIGLLSIIVFLITFLYAKVYENNELQKLNKDKLQSIELWQKSISGELQDINHGLNDLHTKFDNGLTITVEIE